jgi:titin
MLMAEVTTPAAHGTISNSPDGSFWYTPNPGFVGTDTFAFAASDGFHMSAPAQVTVTVLGGGPTVTAKSYHVATGAPLSVTGSGVLAGATDSDPAHTHLTAAVTATPAHGSLQLHADGSFVYTPNAGYSGADSFSYAANDGAATSSPATVTLDVAGTPTLSPRTFSTGLNHVLSAAAPGVLAGATGSDATHHPTPQVVHPPTHGSLQLHADGSFVYTPQKGFSGPDTFAVAAGNGSATGATATFTVNVAPAPQVTSLKAADINGKSTRLTLTFDQPMWSVNAQFAQNFTVVGGLPYRQQVIPIASAVYDAATSSVVLTTSQHLDPRLSYTLVVNGAAPFGLVSSASVLLDGAGTGTPGSTFLRQFTIGH